MTRMNKDFFAGFSIRLFIGLSAAWLLLASPGGGGIAQAGQLLFDGVPVDITTATNESLVIAPGTGGHTQIGVGTGTDSYATTNNDLFVTGILETSGAAYFDSNLTLGSTTSNTITLKGYVASHVIPATDSTYDLGSSTLAWRTLYIDTLTGYNANLALNPASGYSLTGTVTKNASTGNEVAYNLAATINKATSGNYTGLQLNVTETSAPGAANLLFDLQRGGTSMFNVDRAGNVTAVGTITGSGAAINGTTSHDFKINSNGDAAVASITLGAAGTTSSEIIVPTTKNLKIDGSGSTIIPTIDVDANTLDLSTQAVGVTLNAGAANGLSFDTNTLSIDALNHRVGIKTTTPKGELDVNGDVLIHDGKSFAVVNNSGNADFNHAIKLDQSNNIMQFREYTTFKWTNMASGGLGTDLMTLDTTNGLKLLNNTSLVLDSGTGTYAQTYTGTATPMTITANSMTTGNGISISANALTTGNGVNISSTSTAADAYKLINLSSSGAAAAGKNRYGIYSSLTGTGTGTNYGIYSSASGATTNYPAYFTGGPVLVTSGGTPTNATASGDLYVSGKLEVGGSIYGGATNLTGTSNASFTVNSGGSQLILSSTGLTGNRTITFPDTTTTVAGLGTAQTFTAAQTIGANNNFALASGTGTYAQTYTGTATPMTITADSMTTGNGISISANGLSTGSGINIASTSTAANAYKLINLSSSGANATAGMYRYGVYTNMTGTGSTSVNIAGYFAASGGATNQSIYAVGSAGSDVANIYSEQQGAIGTAGSFISSSTSATSTAKGIYVRNDSGRAGGGVTAHLEQNNASAIAQTVYITTNSTQSPDVVAIVPTGNMAGGNALTITNTGTTNSARGIYLRNDGNGAVGAHFEINNSVNSNRTIESYTKGTGNAGFFYNSNSANTSPALLVQTDNTTENSGYILSLYGGANNVLKVDATGKISNPSGIAPTFGNVYIDDKLAVNGSVEFQSGTYSVGHWQTGTFNIGSTDSGTAGNTINVGVSGTSSGVDTVNFNISGTGGAVTYNFKTLSSSAAANDDINIVPGGTGKLKSLIVYNTAVGATNKAVYVDSTGYIGYLASSIRYKDNVKNMEDIDWLYALRPVNYIYKTDLGRSKQYGLIAEEVAKINPSFVSFDKAGKPETVEYTQFVPVLIKSVQDQQRQIEQLKTEIDTLREQNELLKQTISKIDLNIVAAKHQEKI